MSDALSKLRAVVPANVRAVCETLEGAGHEAVTVGGAVRDAILGREPGDWDVATSAPPEDVMKLFKHVIPTGLQHGTVTIVTGKGEASHVEVTTFRGEGAYTDARRPDHVTFGVPLVEDLARRDLRVNAMAYDPAKDRLIDPFEGQKDIAEKTLRAVGPTGNVYDDAVARFSEDGLRVMRAVRFAAVLEFALDPETERGIEPALPSLAKVSKERVCDELRKMLETREPSRALAIAQRTGIMALILPELADGFEAWTAIEDAHHNIVNHWLERTDAAPREARLASLVAELAPAEAVKRLDRAVVKHASGVLRRLKFANDEIAVAAALVGTSGVSLAKDWTDPEVRRLLSDVGRVNAKTAAGFWRADKATALADRADAILARGDALHPNELALSGKDLMTALDMKPGPAIGRILAMLLTRVLDEPARNTREELLGLAKSAELSFARTDDVTD
ncbi:MAG: [cytidine(C)-cytidine(C)-adenosine (A)]-adding enzyme [Myxococcota bacterium]|nr:[cytidine(C)-cytidine(C)-adenosine (A)]-adding enzyme [Myxococcota bacterium]